MDPSSPLIDLDGVSVTLAGRPALREVSWRLMPGEHWAVVGPNGSGKSTFLRVVAAEQWVDPRGGSRRYCFDGATESTTAARDRIGYVAPELHERYVRLALPLDGRAIVESGLDGTIYVQRALDPGERAAVDALLASLALEELARRPLAALSFGEMRRLLVARALVRGPRVLVLDEYTEGLDAASRAALFSVLERVAHGTQLVCASHRRSDFIAATTHVAQFSGGRLVSSGPAHARRSLYEAAVAAPEATQPAREGPQAEAEPLVRIRSASVLLEGVTVLRDLSLEVRRGEHLAISGPNGSGKSTLAGLIAGTVHPAHGAHIERFGKGAPFDLWALKARIAVVSDAIQIDYDVDIDVEGVIASGFAASIGLVRRPGHAELREVASLIARLGIETLAGRPFLRLSFGERRKVLLARSLVRPPELLILDEVWSGIDSDFRTRLEALIGELAQSGTTLIAITHHPDDVPNIVRRTLILERGRLRAA